MIGISTFPYITMSLYDALSEIEKLSSHAEVLSESKHNILLYGEVLSSFNLKYTIHAPITDMNFSSIHPPIRDAAMGVLEDVIRYGVEIGAEVFVVHPGYLGWITDLELAQQRMRVSLNGMEALAKEYGVLIAIENQPDHEYLLFRTPDLLSELDGLGFTLDVGHANTAGMLPDFLEHQVDHLHLHDNNGETDEHLAIGEGNIDFSEVAKATKSDGITKVLELRNAEDLEASLSELKKIYED